MHCYMSIHVHTWVHTYIRVNVYMYLWSPLPPMPTPKLIRCYIHRKFYNLSGFRLRVISDVSLMSNNSSTSAIIRIQSNIQNETVHKFAQFHKFL